MARPQASGFAARTDVRARARGRSKWIRRLVLAAIAAAFAIPILVLVFDSADTTRPVPVPASDRLLPAGPPQPQVIAFQGALRLFLPISESRVTAVGYQAVGDGALALEPVGTQANAGVFTRLLRRLFGQDQRRVSATTSSVGKALPATAGLDVGAPAGTDVYAPVDGTVIAISDRIIERRAVWRSHRHPAFRQPGPRRLADEHRARRGAHRRLDGRSCRERRSAASSTSREVETSALARYTQDSGQHVQIEVHPAANLSLP